MFWVGLGLIITGVMLLLLAHHYVASNRFYTKTPYLFAMGIYSWGQGLVIAPFWVLVGVACLWLFWPIDLLKLYLLFHIIRSGYEVFAPPATDEHQSLYRLFHLMMVIVLLFGFLSLR